MSADERKSLGESGRARARPLSFGSPRQQTPERSALRRTLAVILAALLALALVLGISALIVWGRIETFALEPPGSVAGPQPVYLVVGTDAGIERNPGELQYVAPGEEEKQRADVVILLRMNEDGTAAAVPIPRDVLVPREQQAPARLAMRLLDGPQALVDGVCGALGVSVNRYVSIDAPGFVAAIDALGGVPAEIPLPVRDSKADLELDAGAQVLNGADALALVRSRHTEYLTDEGWTTGGDGAATRTEWSGVVLDQIRTQARSAGPLNLGKTAWRASEGLTVGGGIHPRELLNLARADHHHVDLPVEGFENARALQVSETAQQDLRAAGFSTDCRTP